MTGLNCTFNMTVQSNQINDIVVVALDSVHGFTLLAESAMTSVMGQRRGRGRQ